MVATKQLWLAMETDEERKTRLENVVATTQLRFTQETDEERRAGHLRLSAEAQDKRAARLEHLSVNWIIVDILFINLMLSLANS